VLIGGITLLSAFLFVLLNLLVRRLILLPMVEITEVAKAVSNGDMSREIETGDRNDGIAELANAFELMRRSLLTAMKRIKRLS
jgi:HAMP domain-containing protein